jgi:hypothetical protein
MTEHDPRAAGAAAVLGAYGAVGRNILTAAARRGLRVTAVGRDPVRLQSLRADAHEIADVGDDRELARIAGSHDVVVNATGVESPRLAQVVTSAGAAFVDISAEASYLHELAALRPTRPVLAGTGLAPGLTNVLAAAVPGDEPLQVGIVGGIGDHHGAAGREWVWRMAGRRPVGGSPDDVVYRTSRRFEIPGVGSRTLLRAAFGEEQQLSRSLGREVTSWLGLDPPWATAMLRLAGSWPAAGAFLDRLSTPLRSAFGPETDVINRSYDRWYVVVTAGGEPAAWASGHGETVATAVVTALSLGPTLEAAAGVWTADQLLTLAGIERDLHAAGVVTAVRVPHQGRW